MSRCETKRSKWRGWLTRPPILASLILATVCGGGVPAARTWDFGVGLAATYDDNILNYSERDLFAFRYRLNPPRFALRTTDDFVLSPYVELFWEPDSARASSFAARLEANRYAKNTIRNNLNLELQWRVRPFRRWRLTLAATLLPSYYVRRYIDDDLAVPYPELPRYRDAKYRQAEGAASVEWRPVGSWRGQVGYEYGRRDFLDAFPERDQDRHRLKLSLRPPRLSRFQARLRGDYGRALARGPNPDEAGGSLDPDVSTQSLATGLTLEWTPRSRLPSIALRQAIDYENRRYTTRDTTDTQRFGRSIHETDLEWELALGLSRHWQVTGGYNMVVQRLTGPLSDLETFTDAGSYNRHRVSVSLGWSSRRARSD